MEPSIPTLQFATLPPQPFGEFGPSASQNPESPEAAVERLMEELFDPFNPPGDQPYEGSVYQIMDHTLAKAYEHYGYDLAELAANRRDNPLTEEMFFNYLVSNGLIYARDPVTGEQFSAYEWLQRRVGMGAAGVHRGVIDVIGEFDHLNPMNYEANYLAALYAEYPDRVLQAKTRFRQSLVTLYGEDAAAVYEYLSKLDALGPDRGAFDGPTPRPRDLQCRSSHGPGRLWETPSSGSELASG